MDIRLIQVPYHAGDDRHPAAEGPSRLVESGAPRLLRAQGHAVTIEAAHRGTPFRDTASSSASVNRSVALSVGAGLASSQFPLVLAGSCVTCHGVLGGFEHTRCGAIWVDAHGDFNTPETSTSGFFPGMSLAVLTGHCFRDYWGQIGDNEPLAESAVATFGTRDLSPQAEQDRLERSEITVVGWRNGQPQADVLDTLDSLAARTNQVYLHIDIDGFDPAVAPGVADDPVPGGLSVFDAEMIIRGAAKRFKVVAVTLATYAPAADEEDKTLGLGLRLIELIGAVLL
jgi:arginase